jgi:hypothetical protein
MAAVCVCFIAPFLFEIVVISGLQATVAGFPKRRARLVCTREKEPRISFVPIALLFSLFFCNFAAVF